MSNSTNIDDDEELVNNYFTVKYTQNSGFGAFATVPIKKLTLILVEDPILRGEEIVTAKIAHRNGSHVCQMDDEYYLRDVVGLNDVTRYRLWKMHDQFVGAYETPNSNEKRLYGIIESNAFFSTDENKLGLYPIAARLNHSCKPNCGYGFDGFTLRLFTTKNIEAGEELTDCYSDVIYHGSREYRQAFMEEKFKFRCNCLATCNSSSLEATKTSDERRSRLKYLTLLLGSRSSQIKDAPSNFDLDMIIECVNLLVAEGVDHNMASIYQFAYETAHKLNALHVIRENELGLNCISLLEVSKGMYHPATTAFRDRLNADSASLRPQ